MHSAYELTTDKLAMPKIVGALASAYRSRTRAARVYDAINAVIQAQRPPVKPEPLAAKLYDALITPLRVPGSYRRSRIRDIQEARSLRAHKLRALRAEVQQRRAAYRRNSAPTGYDLYAPPQVNSRGVPKGGDMWSIRKDR